MKRFMCIPIAICLPIIFVFIALVWTGLICYVGYRIGWPNATGIIAIGFGSVIMSLGIAVFTIRKGIWRVEILKTKIVCKGLFPSDTFTIQFDTCSVCMDWHQQSGNTIWWICIFEGKYPEYKGKGVSNRVNSINIQPGFVRIMYNHDVYTSLLEVLPKKQKTALITARRCARFEKNNRIIF